MIEVLTPGPLTTVQDLGRPGWVHLGVGRSGAVDRPSLRRANRLVGNPEDAAALEVTLGGLTLRAVDACTVAVTGAAVPLRVAGRPRPLEAPLELASGDVLGCRWAAVGARAYVAVRGGIDVERVLGSRSTDVHAGLGAAPLRAGDRLPVGGATLSDLLVDVAPVAALPVEPVLRVLAGPRADWFAPTALDLLCASPYEVATSSDRVGVRLRGAALPRAVDRELPSEGMVDGALQVPPDGQPVLLLADHPVTGGYPVVAVVDAADLHLAGQLRPGQRVRFRV